MWIFVINVDVVFFFVVVVDVFVVYGRINDVEYVLVVCKFDGIGDVDGCDVRIWLLRVVYGVIVVWLCNDVRCWGLWR